MPYVASESYSKRTEKVGSGQCVALVKALTGAPATAAWQEGERVEDLLNAGKTIPEGTAIATFVKGRYPNKATGNHAAIFVRQIPNGIEIFDQWIGHSPVKRKIYFGRPASRGVAQRPELYFIVQ
ncbi:BPSL0067 family protein [Pseudoduganella aquatica]|uniref:BPSL0067 family protein n=1 Tax=Pseudoduganella aquatica TaxID=2660641 RepID=UPI001E5247E8|nr:BPSL0067 family protein [Pseudoduganella aquatica]